MKTRIKELRKSLGMTQQKFADAIGVKQNTVAQYEMGRNEPIDSVCSLICKEFNVSEEWLRTGNGEMFIHLSESEKTMGCVARILSDDDNPLKAAFLYAAAEIIDDDACFEIIKSKMLSIIEECKNKAEKDENYGI